MSYRNDFADTLFKKFSEGRRVSVRHFKCHSSLRGHQQGQGAAGSPVQESRDQPPRTRTRSQPRSPLRRGLGAPRHAKRGRVELHFSPERSGREGTRPSPSYRFCCRLAEPATSTREKHSNRTGLRR